MYLTAQTDTLPTGRVAMMTRIFTLLSTPETAQDREMRECIDALAALEEPRTEWWAFCARSLSVGSEQFPHLVGWRTKLTAGCSARTALCP